MGDHPLMIDRSTSKESAREIWRPKSGSNRSNLGTLGDIVQIQPTSATFYPDFQSGISNYHHHGFVNLYVVPGVNFSVGPAGKLSNTVSLNGGLYTSLSTISCTVGEDGQFLPVNYAVNRDDRPGSNMVASGGMSTSGQPNAYQVQHENIEAVGQWLTEADQIARELGRLESGWAGPDSLAPSDQAISDFELIAAMLPLDTVPPLVEVDESDGYISLRWRRVPDGTSFTLVFNGKSEVIGNLATANTTYEPWKLSIRDEATIAVKLDHDDVRQAILPA
jgi:hypothetical protein